MKVLQCNQTVHERSHIQLARQHAARTGQCVASHMLPFTLSTEQHAGITKVDSSCSLLTRGVQGRAGASS